MVVLLFPAATAADEEEASSDSGATASRTPRSASKRDRARLSMLSWTAVIGSVFVDDWLVVGGGAVVPSLRIYYQY